MYSMNYNKLCTDIFSIDYSIRFASVYTKNGDIVGEGMRNDRESLLSPEETTMSFYYSKQMFEMRKNLSHILGKEKYSMTEHADVKMITVPLQDDNLLLISIEPKCNHCEIIEHVLKVVENYSPKIGSALGGI
jgi:hypothetical protein